MSRTLSSLSSRARSSRSPAPVLDEQWCLAELLSENRWVRTCRAYPAGNRAATEFTVQQIRPDLATDSDRELAHGLLLREAQVSREVDHPHLAVTFGLHQQGDEWWLVQPYLAGANLAAADELPPPARLWVVRQIAEALAALHQADWLHGNVSPEAILVDAAGHATLGDLGWSRRLASDECELSGTNFTGQIRYAAPEMFDDHGSLTPATDVYSLGAVLYELLSNRPLLAQYEGPALVAAKRLLAAPEIAAPEAPFAAARLAARMLNRDPLRRPTAQEVVEGLLALEIETFAAWCNAAST